MLAETNGLDVWIAFIGAMVALVSAIIPMWRRTRRAEKNSEEIKDTLGVKNGHGDAMTMLAKALQTQNEVLLWTQHHDDRDDERFNQINDRIEGLERAIVPPESQ